MKKGRRKMTNEHVSTTVIVVGLLLITTYGTLGAQERQFQRGPEVRPEGQGGRRGR